MKLSFPTKGIHNYSELELNCFLIKKSGILTSPRLLRIRLPIVRTADSSIGTLLIVVSTERGGDGE